MLHIRSLCLCEKFGKGAHPEELRTCLIIAPVRKDPKVVTSKSFSEGHVKVFCEDHQLHKSLQPFLAISSKAGLPTDILSAHHWWRGLLIRHHTPKNTKELLHHILSSHQDSTGKPKNSISLGISILFLMLYEMKWSSQQQLPKVPQ